MFHYAITIFISAFLLFQVQPMAARFILPWFGGSSLVWTTCMLFFQVILVLGYSYSHFISQRLAPKRQWLIHVSLLIIAGLCLPIQPDNSWMPTDASTPTVSILLLLIVCIGAPFFILSSTSPLIQSWQSRTHPEKSPYRLFALSNAGSLLALISYPFLIEPFVSLSVQSNIWSVAFVIFAILMSILGYKYQRTTALLIEAKIRKVVKPSPPTKTVVGLWLILPTLASVSLLACTNLMTNEVGAVPFLWILPLCLYLISFIICFEHSRWYSRKLYFPLLLISAVISCFVLEAGNSAPIIFQVAVYSLVCFSAAMCCHGELSLIKPSEIHLTKFYLLVAIGGALGGIFVAIISPKIFPNIYEYQFSLILILVIYLSTLAKQQFGNPTQVEEESNYAWNKFLLFLLIIGSTASGSYIAAVSPEDLRQYYHFQIRVLFICVPLLLAWIVFQSGARSLTGIIRNSVRVFPVHLILGLVTLSIVISSIDRQLLNINTIMQDRNEYGTLSVSDSGSVRTLNNGRTLHGTQSRDLSKPLTPTSYYSASSGLGKSLEFLYSPENPAAKKGLTIAAIGLGVGTVCAWLTEIDTIQFYEINPLVVNVATDHFSYLKQCKGTYGVTLGDARLQLQYQAANDKKIEYDLIIADAFSSDSIPMHLLTVEAFKVYKSNMSEKGILAIHTSNRFMHLENLVKKMAEEVGMKAIRVEDKKAARGFINDSDWVIVTNNKAFLNSNFNKNHVSKWPNERFTAYWTDDFSSVISVINWKREFDWLKIALRNMGWTS